MRTISKKRSKLYRIRDNWSAVMMTNLSGEDGGPASQPPSMSSSESRSASGSGCTVGGSSGASANKSPSNRPAAGSTRAFKKKKVFNWIMPKIKNGYSLRSNPSPNPSLSGRSWWSNESKIDRDVLGNWSLSLWCMPSWSISSANRFSCKMTKL